MGSHLRHPKPRNPKGFFEDIRLRRVAIPHMPPRQRARLLRAWAMREGKGRKIIGAKDGHLCAIIPEMLRAWPTLKIVAVDRPLEEIVASMNKVKTFRRLSPAAKRRRATIRAMVRDYDIQNLGVPVLRLPFVETIKDPAGTVEKIIAFLGINPTPEQRAAAIAFVDPKLRHNVATP